MRKRLDPQSLEDAGVSPLVHFGYEVRLARERLKVERDELAARAHCTYSLVQKIETGERVPRREFAQACDELFPDSHGRFERFWKVVLAFAYPAWFRPYVQLEQQATLIRAYHPLLFPGLVQTEDYARAVLQTERPPNLEDLVTGRMERQRILTQEAPPSLSIILEETVLRRMVGGPAVMAPQLERLSKLGRDPRHVVQIIPGAVPAYAAAGYPYSLLSFDDGADVVHVDGFPRGHVIAAEEDVKRSDRAYNLLRGTALSVEDSVQFIDTVLREIS